MTKMKRKLPAKVVEEEKQETKVREFSEMELGSVLISKLFQDEFPAALEVAEQSSDEENAGDSDAEAADSGEEQDELLFESDYEGGEEQDESGDDEEDVSGEEEVDDEEDDDEDDDDSDVVYESDSSDEVDSEAEEETKVEEVKEPKKKPVEIKKTDEVEKKPTETAPKPKEKEAKKKTNGTNSETSSKPTAATTPVADEYENDTSDEEDIRNTVGNIPMHWYDEYKHIGYDWDAKKIMQPEKGDQLDDFLKRMEDPNFWRTVKDPKTGQNVILTDEDIDLIKRISSQRIPNPEQNEFEPWIEWFTSEVEKMPIRNIPDHKRSFLPSIHEKKQIGRYVHALKMGYMKTRAELEKERLEKKKGPKFYMLWETDTGKEDMRRIHDHVTAPKRDLPGHAESYNPPPEYLFDDLEMKEWRKLENQPHKRKLHFLPQKYNSLREVPAYPRYLRERFLRCLDLYLCPRARRMRLTIEPEYLIPKLPSPRDLQPFPTVETLVYSGHTDMIRTISVDPKGQFIVTGSDDTSIKSEFRDIWLEFIGFNVKRLFSVWEVSTTRCIKTILTKDVVRSVAWCPNSKISMIAVASGQRLLFINPEVGDRLIVKRTDEILSVVPKKDLIESDRITTAVQWVEPEGDEVKNGVRIIINHFKSIKQVTWHGLGDYLATVMPDGANRSVVIHQLSRRMSQFPFSKSKGLVQCVLFHPVKPQLFVAVSGECGSV